MGGEEREEGKRGLRLARMVQQWVWGDPPAGFKRVSWDQTQMMWVREGLERQFSPEEFLEPREPVERMSPYSGRGQLHFVRLNNGETALVRLYHHGGLLRCLTADFFFTWPPRPFRELAATEEVRRRGVPTLEILGALVKRVWGPFYRGWLVSRELRGAEDLWTVLRSGAYDARKNPSMLRVVAQGIKKMHRQGIYHRDLHLKNILVRLEEGEIQSYLIDFDKARLFSGAVPREKAQRNLRRLHRSVCKLDPQRRHLTEEDWDLFTRFYQEAF